MLYLVYTITDGLCWIKDYGLWIKDHVNLWIQIFMDLLSKLFPFLQTTVNVIIS